MQLLLKMRNERLYAEAKIRLTEAEKQRDIASLDAGRLRERGFVDLVLQVHEAVVEADQRHQLAGFVPVPFWKQIEAGEQLLGEVGEFL